MLLQLYTSAIPYDFTPRPQKSCFAHPSEKTHKKIFHNLEDKSLEISFFNSFNRINKCISEYSMYKIIASEEKID